MKTLRMIVMVLGMAPLMTATVYAKPEIGKAAPDFTATGSDGKTYKLSDYKGKYVVLEWYNRDCPFIRKHYEPGNMQMLQDKYGKLGVIWLSVASSAEGKEGYLTAAENQDTRAKVGSKSLATLMDANGDIGRLYEAKTTPHMFIINPAGFLIYNGALDDKPTPYAEDIPKSKNYVAAALDESMAGKPVSKATSKPYGCSVKYK
jgi:peroxiredoxin